MAGTSLASEASEPFPRSKADEADIPGDGTSELKFLYPPLFNDDLEESFYELTAVLCSLVHVAERHDFACIVCVILALHIASTLSYQPAA